MAPRLRRMALLWWMCGSLGAGADQLVPYPLTPEFQVNDTTVSSAVGATVSWGPGDFVVAWQEGTAVLFQRFDPAGQSLGGPIRNDAPVEVQTTKLKPSVSADDAGDFVVVWESHENPTHWPFPTQSDIRGQLFDSAGTADGGVFDVIPRPARQSEPGNAARAAAERSMTAWWADGGAPGVEISPEPGPTNPQVSRNGPGDFVTVAQDYGIVVQRFDAAGVPQGPRLNLGTPTDTSYPLMPSVTIDEQGGFVAAWENGTGTGGSEIQAERFDGAGAAMGSAFVVDPSFGYRRRPQVASDAQGAFVVVLDGGRSGSRGRIFDSTGAPLGDTFTINAGRPPFVGSDKDGSFVVVWSGTGDGDGSGIFAQRYDSAGALQGGAFQVNTRTAGNQANPRVALDDHGDFVVAWNGPAGSGGAGDAEIFVRRYDAAGSAIGVELQANLYSMGNQQLPTIAKAADGAFVVVWESEGQNGSAVGLAGRRFDSNGAPQGGELAIFDTFAESQKSGPAVAADSTDDFVLVWQAQADGDGSGVFAQLFQSGGQPLGAAFQVNQTILGDQAAPRIARASTGPFAVVWDSVQSGLSVHDYYIRRFAADGMPLGDEIKVNTSPPAFGGQGPRVDLNDAGDCVVVWEIPPNGVRARRFGSNGMPLTGEISLSTAPSIGSAVAIAPDGSFIAAWGRAEDQRRDILAHRYSSSGASMGAEFVVNASTAFLPYFPAVSMDVQGNLVVVWNAPTTNGHWSIFGRFYGSNGQPLSEDFEVSDAPWEQLAPSVSLREPGGLSEPGHFAVAWESGGSLGRSILGRLLALGTPTPTPTPQPVGSLGRPGGGRFLTFLALAAVLLASIHVLPRRSASRD
jgi:hypothetical protein